MAYAFDVNGTIPAQGGEAMFRLKSLLKSQGWTVPRSGDGTTYNSSGDQISSGGSGSGGMNRNGAWYVIQSPGLVARQFCIQRSNAGNTYAFRVKYSAGDGFSGGAPAAAQTPSSTDEQIIIGGGTDGAPSFGQVLDTPDGAQRLNIVAGGAAENYSFIWWTQVSGQSSMRSCLMLDVMTPGTYPGLDSDPAVVYWDAFSTLLLESMNSGAAKGWLRKGLSGSGFGAISPLQYYNGAIVVIPLSAAQNPHTVKDDLFPILWARPSNLAAPYGYKGVSSLLRWLSITRANGDTLNVNTTKDFIAIGGSNGAWCAVPWNGSDQLV